MYQTRLDGQLVCNRTECNYKVSYVCSLHSLNLCWHCAIRHHANDGCIEIERYRPEEISYD